MLLLFNESFDINYIPSLSEQSLMSPWLSQNYVKCFLVCYLFSPTIAQGRFSMMLRARRAVWPGHRHELKNDACPLGLSTCNRLSDLRCLSSLSLNQREHAMEIIYHRCCGLDVHKRRVSACVRRLEADDRMDQFYFCPETENRKLYSSGTARWQAVK